MYYINYFINLFQSKTGGWFPESSFSSIEYINFSNVPAWTSSSTLFGIDFWWRPTNISGSGRQSFFNGQTDGQWLGFGYDESVGKLDMEVPSASGGWQGSMDHGSKSNYAINTWYHIALAKTSATNISYYVDGVLDKSQTIAYINKFNDITRWG